MQPPKAAEDRLAGASPGAVAVSSGRSRREPLGGGKSPGCQVARRPGYGIVLDIAP